MHHQARAALLGYCAYISISASFLCVYERRWCLRKLFNIECQEANSRLDTTQALRLFPQLCMCVRIYAFRAKEGIWCGDYCLALSCLVLLKKMGNRLVYTLMSPQGQCRDHHLKPSLLLHPTFPPLLLIEKDGLWYDAEDRPEFAALGDDYMILETFFLY